jgi:hypothetical protein
MREMGFSSRIFDLLDERKLSKDELRDFFQILYGNSKMDGVPDPEADWKGFLAGIPHWSKARRVRQILSQEKSNPGST